MSQSHLWLTDSRKSTKEEKKNTFRALLIKPKYIPFLVRLLCYTYMGQWPTGQQEIDNKLLPLRIANQNLDTWLTILVLLSKF